MWEILPLTLNMRGKGKSCDIANILPSVRARGVLVPLIVREKAAVEVGAGEGQGESENENAGCGDNAEHLPAYEILAGKRRYHAALAVIAEGVGIEDLPCAVLEPGDNAAALEASLIENIARLDPDEMTRCETFTRLVREGREIEAIAHTFGLTALQVKRTLALGNLVPRLRSLYRDDRIDVVSLRHLTMASKARQRQWLALYDDEAAYVPMGNALKAWLFGGASIPVSAALFSIEDCDLVIATDLFGEESYFADADAFWPVQMQAVEERVDAYREAGWEVVVVMERGMPFHTWEHERRAKSKGGRVYVTVGHRGDVAFHEGYVTMKEARRLERGEGIARPARPEVSGTLNAYIDLHRHAAVRAKLATDTGLALRVMVAHAIAGSALWAVRVEPQRAPNDAVAESVEGCASEADFDANRRAVLALLRFDPDTPTVTGGDSGEHGVCGLVHRLIGLPDEDVLAILGVVMGETLDMGTSLVELLGRHLGIEMRDLWQADDALLDAVRDREVIGHLLADVAGEEVASANAKATTKVQRGIIRDCLTGGNGRAKLEGWVPKWMAFPPSGYTERGGIGSVGQAARIENLTTGQTADEPEGEAVEAHTEPGEPLAKAA